MTGQRPAKPSSTVLATLARSVVVLENNRPFVFLRAIGLAAPSLRSRTHTRAHFLKKMRTRMRALAREGAAKPIALKKTNGLIFQNHSLARSLLAFSLLAGLRNVNLLA